MTAFIDLAVEAAAMRDAGMLGRGDHMGNALYAIDYGQLPPEARTTIQSIITGGPFPFPQHDGKFFQNRFGDLPSNTEEYREFTVVTPGAPNRGKRRIISRRTGILFFTACHYERVQGNMPAAARVPLTEQVDPEWRNGFYVITGMTNDMRAEIAAGLEEFRNRRLPVVVS